MTTIGIIGSGNIGSNVARAAVAAGHHIVIANSRGPESLTDLIDELGDNARAAETNEAASAGDLTLIAIPLGKVFDLEPAPFDGQIIVDANNYYPQRDGRIEALDTNEATTSELVAAHFPNSRVVKAFNHITAHQIPADGRPAGDPERRGLVIAGEDTEAKAHVTAFLDSLGYDAVDLGSLSESWRIERDTPGYGPPLTRAQYEELLPTVERVQQT